jgi:hypothetical protein
MAGECKGNAVESAPANEGGKRASEVGSDDFFLEAESSANISSSP